MCGLLWPPACSWPLHAQPDGYSTKDKKAIKVYLDALECLHVQDWNCAESNLKKALVLDEAFIEPRFTMAELYDMQGKEEEAMAAYREALHPRSPFLSQCLPASG